MSYAISLILLGAVLQIAGVATVGLGVKKLRESFSDRPGIVGSISAASSTAWRRLVGRTESATEARKLQVGAEVRLLWKVDAKLSAVADWESLDIEARTDQLRRSIESVTQSVEQLAARNADALELARDALVAEIGQVAGDVEDVRGTVQELATGGLRLQTWGVVLLWCGIAMTAGGSWLAA